MLQYIFSFPSSFCFRSENLTVEEDGVTANITTFTRETKKHKNPEILSCHFYIPAWLTKSISFKFDEPFLVQHGNTESKSKERIDEVCREMPRTYLTFLILTMEKSSHVIIQNISRGS